MSDLADYLEEKREKLLARQKQVAAGVLGRVSLAARVTAEGRSGIRRIRIRDHQVVTDSPPDFAGYDLGPSSPELQLGILGSCLNHSVLIQAAALGIDVSALDVEVSGTIDARAGHPDHPDIPVQPHDIAFAVHIETAADDAALRTLQANVERLCPILNLLRKPQEISGRFDIRRAPVRQAAE